MIIKMSSDNQSDNTVGVKKNNSQTRESAHRQFIEAAYARIKDIGTGRFVSSSSTVTNTGGYIQVSRNKK
jgi:hypothetical protein